MTVKDTDIKVYVHTNLNAPTLQNTWGQLAGVLDACLINGYGLPAISSIAVADNVLSITFASNHQLLAGQVILLSGADQAVFNRQFRIGNVPSLIKIQIDLDATFPATITGTLGATVPPLGWVKEFSSGGKRAYRNTKTSDASRPFLRVVDEIDPAWDAGYAKYAKVGIVENMTDIDTMIGLQTPYNTQNPTQNWVGTGSGVDAVNGWAKWYYSRRDDVYSGGWYDSEGTNGSNKRWLIVGNGAWFYILPSQVDSLYPNAYFFGELSVGIYGLSSSLQYDTANNNRQTNNKTALSSGTTSFLLHIGETVGVRALGMQSGGNDGPSGSSAYYEPLTSALVASDVYVSRFYNNQIYRFKMPSLKWLMNPYDANYELKTIEDADSAYLLKTVCATTGASAVNGMVGFKLY